MDAVGAKIRIDVRGREVMRVLPRVNEDVNEEWLSDKSRFAYDGLKDRRLDRPYVRKNGKLEAASWTEAFAAIAGALKDVAGSQIAAIAGDMACGESVLALKRSDGHTSELQSLMRKSYAVYCMTKKTHDKTPSDTNN